MPLLIMLDVPACSVMAEATLEFCALAKVPPARVMARVRVLARPFCAVVKVPPELMVIVPVPAMLAPSEMPSVPWFTIMLPFVTRVLVRVIVLVPVLVRV